MGDELDDFTLPDLDGAERSLSEFRGKRVLLVNWSPGCGFCVKIAAELGALHPLLVEHDVELVLRDRRRRRREPRGVRRRRRLLRPRCCATAPTSTRSAVPAPPRRI